MRHLPEGQHFVFWKIANGFILMPRHEDQQGVDDEDVLGFKDLHEMYDWLEGFYVKEKKKRVTTPLRERAEKIYRISSASPDHETNITAIEQALREARDETLEEAAQYMEARNARLFDNCDDWAEIVTRVAFSIRAIKQGKEQP